MAYTYAGLWGSEVFEDADRRLLRNHPFYVYEAGTSNLATLYTDRTKSAIAPNPATTDAYGNGHFYAEPGIYDIESNGLRVTETVEPDPEDEQGLSAYGVAVENGFVGTEEEWLTSLKGEPGEVSQAELDAAQAAAIQRANHTGTQAIATVSGLQSVLDAKETPAGAQAKADAALGAANTYTDDAVDNATSGAARSFVSGRYYDAGHGSNLGVGAMDVLNQAMARSFPVDQATSFDRIGIVITALATAGGVMRLGIYADNAGVPGALVVQTAALPTDSSNNLNEAIISASLTPGMYWLVGVFQVASPNMRRFLASGGGDPNVGTDDPFGDGGSPFMAYVQNGVSGALPDPFVVHDVKTGVAPRIFVRAV